jgi:CheY-like chemotaxis protein
MRILLVDDQSEVREAVKMLLEFDENAVTGVGSGREALETFSPGRFDVVITDYAMPGMRGDELAARIKQMSPAQPILMITGSVDQAVAAKYAVDGYLGKPFALEALRRAIVEARGVGAGV